MTVSAYAVISELSVPYDKHATQQRRDGYFKRFMMSILGLAFSVLVLLVIWLLFRPTELLVFILYGVHLGISLARFGYVLTRWLVARRTLKRIPDGTAVLVDRRGIAVAGLAVPWDEVTRMVARTPMHWSTGRITLHAGERRSELRVDQLPVDVSTIASAIEIFSAGTTRLDVAKLAR